MSQADMDRDVAQLKQDARRMGETISPVNWETYSQMKSYDHGVLPHLRQMAGFEDTFGMGTYTACPGPEEKDLLIELVEAFREAATGEDIIIA